MTKKKLYKARSITGAQARVRQLTVHIETYEKICRDNNHVKLLLAKLAAEGPCFYNPLDAMAAKKARDYILQMNGLNPDGTLRKTTQKFDYMPK